MIYGASFSPEYASYLGFDFKKVYKKILNEWNFKHVRLSAQWNLIEKKQGEFNFDDLDWLMNESGKRIVKVILVVGQKVPRWPECHLPDWVDRSQYSNYKPALFNFIATVVQRYKNHPSLEFWQVENEPFLKFGSCMPLTADELAEEIGVVKKLDSAHPVIITDSGELSTWRKTAKASDIFGTTLYRVVWNETLGYFSYRWLPAFVYTAKLWLNGRDPASAFITELQAEPWIPNRDLKEMPVDEQYKSMSLKQMKRNLNYAEKIGMSRAYLWGAEWWYWLESRGISDFSLFMKSLKKE